MKKNLLLLSLMVVLGACDKQPEYVMNENAFCENRRELACENKDVFCDDYREIFICEDANGKKITGHVVAWYSNGNKYADFDVKKGLVSGEALYFEPNGDIQKIATYKNGILHGMVKEFIQGKIEYLTKYKYGEDIESTKYDIENGSVIGRVYSANGVTKKYDGNGRLVSESKEKIVTKNENNEIEKEYDENGALKAIKYYTVYTNQKFTYTGVEHLDDKTRYLIGSEEYKDGKLDGMRIRYYDKKPGKSVLYSEEWKNGKLNGVVKAYINDKLDKEITYVNGIKTGMSAYSVEGVPTEKYTIDGKTKIIRFFYPDGNLRSVIHEEYDSKHGKQKSFYPNGKLESEEHYKNGNKDGMQTVYREDGVTEYIHYADGVEKSKYLGSSFFTSDGKMPVHLNDNQYF